MIKAFDTIGDGLGDMPYRVFDVAGNAAVLVGNQKLATSVGVGASALSAIHAVGDLFHIPGRVIKCTHVAQDHGLSFKLLNTCRKLFATIGSFIVSAGYALNLPGIVTGLSKTLGPFLPWGDALLHINDSYSNVRQLGKKLGGKCSVNKQTAFQLKLTQNKWELAKNALLATSALVAAVGITLLSGVLFAISVTALALTMVAFFAKQKHNDFVMKHGTFKLT